MTVWADRYAILSELGRGGNGVVYRVRDEKIGRELALKLLGSGEETLVVREAHALTALESPHVLRVFNAGVHNDVPFLATDIAAMGSTEDQIIDGIPVPPELAVRWVRQALVGLDYCHRLRVLHRDITPGNIFLQSNDHALLGDFGVATNLDEDGTAPAGGNQRCRALEGFGGRLTTRSDLFSVGATLWRLLTGTWPYDAGNEADLAEAMSARPPRLRDAAPHVHRSIAVVVESALDPDRERRPASASEMARRLAECRTHARNWVRLAPVDDADLVYASTAGGSTIVLKVWSDGRRRMAEARHSNSGNRVAKGCFETTAGRLAVELRRTFDSL